MSFSSRLEQSAGDAGRLRPRAASVLREEHRSDRSGVIAAGTLACRRCDAPVAIGSQSLSLRDPLTCSFCFHAAIVRDFLSLASPTRTARVVIRVSVA